MGLQQFERRLERLVEGVFAKAFRSGVQPVEIGRRLRREMDQHRSIGVRGTMVPNHFTVAVSPTDHENFQRFADRSRRVCVTPIDLQGSNRRSSTPSRPNSAGLD